MRINYWLMAAACWSGGLLSRAAYDGDGRAAGLALAFILLAFGIDRQSRMLARLIESRLPPAAAARK